MHDAKLKGTEYIKALNIRLNLPIRRTYRRSRWRFTYSALRGLPARRLDKKGTTVITDELMAYDQDANPVCVRDTTTGSPGSRDFSYDARNRLIKASAPNQGWISSEYQYDSQDNIKLARLGVRQYNYTQNTLNQLASITQPATAPSAVNYGLGNCADASMSSDLSSSYTGPTVAIPSPGTPGTATNGGTQTAKYTFSTDNEGRMTAKGTQAYVYDALNRMSQVTGKETYLYDGHGRRVQITKTADGSINYSLYSLDGKLLLEDNRQTLTRTEYIFAGGRLVAKKIQPITAAGVNNGAATMTYIHTDFLGSPVAETNSAGTVTRIERYTPYGEPSDMQLDAGPGFTGHATDVLTGLTYMQQRYYDPICGCFISPDPVQTDPNTGGSFNRYNYANNNPFRFTDPDGRAPDPVTVATRILPAAGESFGALAAVGVGSLTGDDALANAGMEGLQEISNSNIEAITSLVKLPGSSKILVAISGKGKGGGAEHTKGSRPSTKGKHEQGQARKQMDRGGEKGDAARTPPRKAPPNHKGPWPSKPQKTGRTTETKKGWRIIYENKVL